MHSIILHVQNEDPILGELEEIPLPGDFLLVVKNPRRKDGKPLHYIDEAANTVIWPFDKVNFVEIVGDEKSEEIITFVRE